MIKTHIIDTSIKKSEFMKSYIMYMYVVCYRQILVNIESSWHVLSALFCFNNYTTFEQNKINNNHQYQTHSSTLWLFTQVVPLHCPQVKVHPSPCFLQEHVFFSQLPVQLQRINLKSDAGAATLFLLCGLSTFPRRVWNSSQPHSVAAIELPCPTCTWW